MRIALDQAHNAMLVGEVPVGAVVMRGGQVATGYNRPITEHDPAAHAEIVALRHAAQLLGNTACRSARFTSRWAVRDVRDGHVARAGQARGVRRDGSEDGCGGVGGRRVRESRLLNHHTLVQGGVLAQAGGDLLRGFRRSSGPAPPHSGGKPCRPAGGDGDGDDSASRQRSRSRYGHAPRGDSEDDDAPIPTGDVRNSILASKAKKKHDHAPAHEEAHGDEHQHDHPHDHPHDTGSGHPC